MSRSAPLSSSTSDRAQGTGRPWRPLLAVLGLLVVGFVVALAGRLGFGEHGAVVRSIGYEQLGSVLTSPGTIVSGVTFLLLLLATDLAWRGRLAPRRFLAVAYLAAVIATLGLCTSGTAGGGTLAKSIYNQGYSSDAHDFTGPLDVVASYHDRQPDLLPHSRTHPPGPVLFFSAVNAVASEVATRYPDAAGFSDRAVLTFALEGNLGGILVILVAALWLLPLFGYARGLAGAAEEPSPPEAPSPATRAGILAVAWGAGSLGFLLHAPVFDVVHLLPVTGAAWVWQRSLATGSAARGAATGLLLGVLLCLAFGNLVLLPLFVWIGLGGGARSFGGIVVGLLAIGTGLFLLGYDYAEGLRSALGYHAAGVNTARPYLPALVVSPGIFLLWLGAPTLIGAGLGSREKGERRQLAAGLLLLLVALTFSGIAREETERLWLPLVPFCVALAAVGWSTRIRGRGVVALLLTANASGVVLLALVRVLHGA